VVVYRYWYPPKYGALLVLAAGSVLDLLLDGATEKPLKQSKIIFLRKNRKSVVLF
jgi:hypothetical protein